MFPLARSLTTTPCSTMVAWVVALSIVAAAALSGPVFAGFRVDDVQLSEGDSGLTAFEFTVTLNTCPLSCSVDYSTMADTAADPSDYQFKGDTLTFGQSGGEQSRTVTIWVLGDGVVERDETFELRLSGASGSGIDDGVGIGTILNDEVAVVAFDETSGDEGDFDSQRFYRLTLSLSAPVDVDVEVSWQTVDGTARVDLDEYFYTFGTETFTAGTTSPNQVTVRGRGDDLVERDETFLLEITNLEAAGRPVSVGANGTVTMLNDEIARITISDLQVPEGDSANEPLVIAESDHRIDINVFVPCSIHDGTASVSQGDFESGCIGASFGPAHTASGIRLDILGDSLVELDEHFEVRLDEVEANGRAVVLVDDRATVTLLNDDCAELRILDRATPEGDAGTTDLDFEVSLDSDVDAPVDVNFRTMDDTAEVADSDYVARLFGSLTLSGLASEVAWATIQVIGDEQVEPDEQFKIVLENLGASGRCVGFESPESPEAIGTILDDDTCQLSDDETLQGVTVGATLLVEACRSITVGPNVFVDGPQGELILRAGERVSIAEIAVGAGASLRIEVDP